MNLPSAERETLEGTRVRCNQQWVTVTGLGDTGGGVSLALPPRLREPCSGNTHIRLSSGKIEHRLAVLLERLPCKDLREQVGRVGLAGDVAHVHHARAAELAHLEQLPVDVARVLGRGVAVAEVERRLAVGADLHG